MIKLYSPENEVQLAILRSIFDAEGIPIFVHNDHFGSMRTGMQIDLLNKKTIMVHEADLEKSREIIRNFLAKMGQDDGVHDTVSSGYSIFDKHRMVVEGLLFGRVMPGNIWPKRK